MPDETFDWILDQEKNLNGTTGKVNVWRLDLSTMSRLISQFWSLYWNTPIVMTMSHVKFRDSGWRTYSIYFAFFKPWNYFKIKVFKKEKKKKKIIKVAREKIDLYTREPLIRLSADFSAQTLQGGKEGHEIFKVLKQTKKNPAT